MYEGDNTTGQRIKRINYAYAQVNTSTNAKASIVFDYADRTDTYRVYISGYSYRYSKKLTNIKTYNNNALERTYNFYYQTKPAKSLAERLDQVEECFGTDCYPRMSFSYTPERDYQISSNGGSSLDVENLIDYKFFDINGDGILDIAWVSQYPINAADFAYKHVVKFALGTGVGYLQKSYERVFYGNLPSDTTLHVIDYNADGRQDLLVRSYDNRWHALVAQPMVTGEWTFGIAPGIPFQNRHVGFVDLTGDGLTDAYFIDGAKKLQLYKLVPRDNAASHASNMRYQFSFMKELTIPLGNVPPAISSSPWTIDSSYPEKSADYNGDGRVDIVLRLRRTVTQYNTYPPQITTITADAIFITKGEFDSPDFEFFSFITAEKPIDINGDGLPDKVSGNSFQLNTGAGFSDPINFSVNFASTSISGVQRVDINQDGYLDVVWNDTFNKMIRYGLWNSHTEDYDYFSTQYPLLSGQTTSDDTYQFLDATGDGWIDLIQLSPISGSNNTRITLKRSLPSINSYKKPWLLTGVVDGLNRELSIDYKRLNASGDHYSTIWGVNSSQQITTSCYPLTYNQSITTCIKTFSNSVDVVGFYQQMNNPFSYLGASAPVPDYSIPVLEVVGSPNYVVTSVDRSMPAANDPAFKARTLYRYHHARAQAGGRGFLGFEKLTTIDLQTGIQTETSYHQDWPYLGMPLKTKVYSGNLVAGQPIILSEADNTWASARDEANNGIYRVFLDKVKEVNYGLNNNGLAQGASLQTVETDTDYDEYGNVTKIMAIASGSANTSVKTTFNTYYSSVWEKRRGRLQSTRTETTKNNSPAVTRLSQFEYYGQSDTWPGMLKTEIIEPGVNQLAVSYEYDNVGNPTVARKTATVKPGVPQTRKTETVYDSSRRFVETTKDSLGNLVSGVVTRNTLGLPTQIKDTNGVLINILYTVDGREYQRSDSTGAWSHVNRAFCDGSSVVCPAGARYRVESLASGGGKSTDYFDRLERIVRSSRVMFDGRESYVDTEYDRQGRIARKSEPYFSGDPVYWSVFEYDLLGRVVKLIAPDTSITTTVYDGYKTIITNALGQTRIEEKNSLGHVVKVADHLGGTITYGVSA